MKEFGVRRLPSSAYIDAEGSLIGFTLGHSSSDKIKEISKNNESEVKAIYCHLPIFILLRVIIKIT